MSEPQKDTIYIDVDDEITGIIDKVTSSDHKIVALVLPKRATVLQSVVNMKLLKRNADKAKKKLVLITSETGLLPLAGAVGLHVAKNLQSKPVIPTGPDNTDIPESLVDEEEIESEEDPEIDKDAPIGALAGVAAAAAVMSDDEETIDIDNSDESIAAKSDKPGKSKKAPKTKKDAKLKVPNFERFRKWLIIGGIALIVLLIGGYFAMVKMPKAKIVINADSTALNATIEFTASTTSKTFDQEKKIVPAELALTKKTDNQTAPATGQKNNGSKASGTVTMSIPCSSISSGFPTIPAGTGISANGLTYITQTAVTLDSAHAPPCTFSGTTTVTAQNGGANYNTTSTSFAVAGYSNVTANGSANGGTDNMVKVVSQADVDAAKAKSTGAANSEAAKNELTASLKKNGMYAIASSFANDPPAVTSTPNVGDQADSVAVTTVVNYTMLGVNQDDMTKLIDDQLKGQIDNDKQAILDNGLGEATFTVNGKDNPQVSVQTTATVGPNLDTDAIKKEIAGKKKAETIEIISSRPSIKSVTVNYSPFWVTKTPSNPDKVTITFEKASK